MLRREVLYVLYTFTVYVAVVRGRQLYVSTLLW